MGWIIFFVVLVIIIIAIAFFFFVAWMIDAGFKNKYPMDKYDLLTTIADEDIELQLQKDMFISKATETEKFDISQNFDVMNNIHNLIYPNQKYSSVTCPNCGKNPFWILGEQHNDMKTGDWKEDRWDTIIRYYAICSSCITIIHHYDESIYDREVFKRIDTIVENEESKTKYIGKISTVRQKRNKFYDELNL